MQNKTSSKRLKTLAGLIFFLFTVGLVVMPASFGIDEDALETEDFVLSAVKSTISNEPIEIQLENKTDAAILVEGPVYVKALLRLEGQGAIGFPTEALSTAKGDMIFDGSNSISIGAGETKTIAVIAPGLADTWRPHTAADYDVDLSAYVKIGGYYYHLQAIELVYAPADFSPGLELVLDSPKYYPDDEYYGIDIYLKNTDTNTDVTINSPLIIQEGDTWTLLEGYERMRFNLKDGDTTVDTLVIPAGETVLVSEVEPGAPGTWLQLYSPVIRQLTVWAHVSESRNGEGVWQSEQETFAIVGDASEPDNIYGTVLDIVDLEDGTAAITVRVNQAFMTNYVEDKNGQYEHVFDQGILEDQFVTDMKKSDFSIYQQVEYGEASLIGDLLSVRPGAGEGEYVLVWAYEDGKHVNIGIWGAPPGTDKFGPFYDIEERDNRERHTVTISTLNRKITQEADAATGKYVGKLTYPSVNITFTSDTPVDAEINLRQKASTARPLPESGPMPAGLYYDINVASGDISDAEITLEIAYNLDDIPAGMNEADLKLFRYNESTEVWDLLPDQTIDTVDKIIRVTLTGFSEFGVFEFAVEDETEEEPADEDETVDEETDSEDADEDETDDRESIPDTGSATGSNRLAAASLIMLLSAGMLMMWFMKKKNAVMR